MPATPRARGFSLVELLLALTLGIGLIAAFLEVLQRCRTDFAANQSLAGLQDTSRHALGVLADDLEHAGFYGFAMSRQVELTSPLPASAHDCGADVVVDLTHPVSGSDNGYRLPVGAGDCAPTASADGASPSADTLTIRRASLERTAPRAGRIQLQSSALASSGRPQMFADGHAPRAVDDLHEVRDLEVRTYYVANSSVGRPGWPALRVKTLTESRGLPQFRDEEIMPGIEDLQVELRVVQTEDGVRRVRHVPVDSEYARSGEVIAATVWLRVRADVTEAGYRDDTTLSYANTTFTPDTSASTQRRLVAVRTVSLRNARPA